MRKQILQNAVDHVLYQAQAARQVRESFGWSSEETRVAYVDFLMQQHDLSELANDLQNESVDSLADAIEREFDRGWDEYFNLHKLVLSRIDWKQLAARLLEWAGVQVPARPEGGGS